MTTQRFERLSHPRSVAASWWLVTLLCLFLLGQAWLRTDWPYKTPREEVVWLFWLVAIALPGLFLLVFGQQTWVDEQALTVHLGAFGLIRKRIPLAAIRTITAVEVDSIADFSRKETGGHGRGMTCYYTSGRLGVEVVTDRKRYFISSRTPDVLVQALQERLANP